MPVREIRWQNFRAFKDTGWLPIRPITVLLGANNSGKSSILTPLLLLKQTLRSERAQSALVVRGDLTNAGSFHDFVHAHAPQSRVTFSIRFHRRPSAGTTEPELGRNAPGVAEFTFKSERAPGVVSLHRYAVNDAFGRPLLVRTKQGSSRRYSLEEIEEWAPGLDSEPESASDSAARTAILKAVPYHFLFDSDSIWSEALEVASRRATNDSAKEDQDESLREAEAVQMSSFVTKYSSAVDFTGEHIQSDLKDVLYLGPLREIPKRLYELSGDAPRDVGVRGQFSPEILLRARNKTLFKQVNRWLKQFGLPGELTCRPMTDTAFELLLDGSEHPATNFADVGFGFSQLLPLLVQGLTASRSNLLITEQPEIHLNPRLQSRLADFFLTVNKRGSSVLIETHSEHLVLALRRLVAEGRIEAADVAIYYVEAGVGESTVRPVPLQENGHINKLDWPSGFFEDVLRESFALASAQARRRSAE